MLRRWLILALLLCGLAPSVALAQAKNTPTGTPLGMLDLDDSGALSKEFVAESGAALREMFASPKFAGRYKLVNGNKLSDLRDLFSCEGNDERCFDKISASLKTKLILYSWVTRSGSEFTLSAGFYDGEKPAKSRIGTVQQREKLRASEVAPALVMMASSLLGVDPAGRVSVKVNAPGATVAVDGKTQPQAAPLELSLAPGSYELSVSAPGYRSARHRVEVAMWGEHQTLLDLEKLPESSAGNPQARLLQLGGAGGIVLGAAMGGLWIAGRGKATLVNQEFNALVSSAGAPANLFAETELNGNRELAVEIATGAQGERICSRASKDAFSVAPDALAVVKGACRFESLLVPGLVFFGGGLAAVIVGTVGLPKKESRAVVIAPRLSPQEAGVLLQGRF
jgi:hypothetical protein